MKVCFFAEYKHRTPGEWLHKDKNGVLHLNVAELAREFVKAIDEIATSKRSMLKEIPEDKDQSIIDAIRADMEDTWEAYAGKLPVLPQSSASAQSQSTVSENPPPDDCE